MATLDLLLNVWPLLVAFFMAAFWLGILQINVRNNSKDIETLKHDDKEMREKVQSMEVNQAGWTSIVESIFRRLDAIDKKLDKS